MLQKLYFNIRAIAFFNYEDYRNAMAAQNSSDEKAYKRAKQLKKPKNKQMLLRVVNDDNQIEDKHKFELENFAEIKKNYHAKIRHPETMSFGIELYLKRNNRYEECASVRINTHDLPVDLKSCHDIVMDSVRENDVYTVRVITHVSQQYRPYKCNWIKSPFKYCDIPYLINLIIDPEDREDIPDLEDDEEDFSTPLLISL